MAKLVGARVYNDAAISVANNTGVALTFNSETYDTDTIHDTSTNTGRLTCKTAGIYLIVGSVRWEANATGERLVKIDLGGVGSIGYVQNQAVASAGETTAQIVTTIYNLAVNQYVELAVYQLSLATLNILATNYISPYFMMQRIG